MDNRTKRIIRLETLLRDSGKGDNELRAELAKVKAEYRSLKVRVFSEMTNVQSEYNELLSKSRKGARDNREAASPGHRKIVTNSSAAAAGANASPSQSSTSNPAADKRWLLRFQELETRLKAEQEGRALDQKSAKIRLDEVRKENAELRNEISSKEKEEVSVGSSGASTKSSKDKMREGNVE